MKLNNKGFTLVELLIVIVILGLISGITVGIVIGNINNAKNEASTISYSNIKSMANSYVQEVSINWYYYDEDNEYSCITIGDMVEIGYFDENKVSGSGYDNDTNIMIIRDIDSKIINNVFVGTMEEVKGEVDIKCNNEK